MDQAVAFLAALRAAQHLTGAPLAAARVEALATGVGLQPDSLPALMTRLQRQGAIILVWGGSVEVQPEKLGNTVGHVVTAGSGAVVQIAGDRAIIGPVTTSSAGIGELAVALEQLRTLRPTLSGEAAKAAQATESVLAQATSVQTSASERPALVSRAVRAMKSLLASAPQLKDLAELIENASDKFS